MFFVLIYNLIIIIFIIIVIEIKSTLDKLIAARTSLGYDYIVYGLLLINEDQTRVSNITKALYIDIAAHYETSWSCV